MGDAPVLVDRADGVVTVTLNRPDRRNSLNGAMLEALIRTLEEVAATPEDRCLVLVGAGDGFCSGFDLRENVRPDELTFMRRVSDLCILLHDLPITTIAAVRGPAIGFGCNLALCCDFVLAADDALFGETFATLGLTIDGGGSWALSRRVGLAKAKEIVLFGQTLTGVDAADCGMANRAVPADALNDLVTDWAARLARGPKLAVSMMKAELNRSYETAFADAIDAEAVAQAFSFRSKESREGVAASMEKRPPDFRGL